MGDFIKEDYGPFFHSLGVPRIYNLKGQGPVLFPDGIGTREVLEMRIGGRPVFRDLADVTGHDRIPLINPEMVQALAQEFNIPIITNGGAEVTLAEIDCDTWVMPHEVEKSERPITEILKA